MKLFLDTNIFPEFIDRRAQYDRSSRRLLYMLNQLFVLDGDFKKNSFGNSRQIVLQDNSFGN